MISGTSVFGGVGIVMLIPLDKPGIYWRIDEKDVPIRQTNLERHAWMKCLVLTFEGKKLYLPEHLFGILCAAGITGVAIWADKLPYDGAAEIFWKTLKSNISRNDHAGFNRYTPAEALEIPCPKGNIFRFVPSTSSDDLIFSITVDYENVGRETITGSVEDTDLDLLASSKPFGGGMGVLARPLARLTSREDQFVWFEHSDELSVKKRKLQEVARHRLLDFLGALCFVTPPDGMLVGKVESPPFASHATDMIFLEQLKEVGLQKIST